jgi:hypothetical protein
MPLMDDFEVKKWLLWSASQDLSIAALGAQQRKQNGQPHFHICAARAQIFLAEKSSWFRAEM